MSCLDPQSLEAVYGEHRVEEQRARYTTLSDVFKAKYGTAPDWYIRAPGRVNLIGEHIDYAGFDVLPVALTEDVVIAGKSTTSHGDARTRMGNIKVAYPPEEYASQDVATLMQDSRRTWGDYIRCGHLAILEASPGTGGRDVDLMVDGRVPEGAGLSSSSALVVASTLAMALAHDLSFTREEFATMAARCERHVGTCGGGMDQAISLLGKEGRALRTSFHPVLSTTAIPMPAKAALVVAHSMTQEFKRDTAPYRYNMRVAEMRLAMRMIREAYGEDVPPLPRTWVDTLAGGDAKVSSTSGAPDALEHLQTALDLAMKAIPKEEGYTQEEICTLLHITPEEYAHDFLHDPPVQADRLYPRQRIRHILTEAGRVIEFCAKAAEGASLSELGRLMDGSQESLRGDYACSSVELDDLTRVCREEGACGSRLTGAGWGGCAISLILSGMEGEFIERVKMRYYSEICGLSPGDSQLSGAIFAFTSGSGATRVSFP